MAIHTVEAYCGVTQSLRRSVNCAEAGIASREESGFQMLTVRNMREKRPGDGGVDKNLVWFAGFILLLIIAWTVSTFINHDEVRVKPPVAPSVPAVR